MAEPVDISSSQFNNVDCGQSTGFTNHTGPSSYIQDSPEPDQYVARDVGFLGRWSYAPAPRSAWPNELEPTTHLGPHSNSSSSTPLQHPSPGYLTDQPNSFLSSLAEAQAPQCIEEVAQQLQLQQSIDVYAEVDPWYPGSRVRRSSLSGRVFSDHPQLNLGDHPVDSDSSLLQRSHRDSTALDGSYDDARSRSPASTCRGSTRASLDTRHSNTDTGAIRPGRDKVTTCGLCRAQFTGRYQQGNYSRHMRQQHSRTRAHSNLECVCRVCKKEFNRQDARRKHEWKQHSLPDAEPTSRSRAYSNISGLPLPDHLPLALAQAAGSEDSTRPSSQAHEGVPVFSDPLPDQPHFSESSIASFTHNPQLVGIQHHVAAAQMCTEPEMPGWLAPPSPMQQMPLSPYPFSDDPASTVQNPWTSQFNGFTQPDDLKMSQQVWFPFENAATFPKFHVTYPAPETLGYPTTSAIYQPLNPISGAEVPAHNDDEFPHLVNMCAIGDDDDDDYE